MNVYHIVFGCILYDLETIQEAICLVEKGEGNSKKTIKRKKSIQYSIWKIKTELGVLWKRYGIIQVDKFKWINYICVWVYALLLCVFMHVPVRLCACGCVCTCVFACACLRVCLCMCFCVCVCVWVCLYVFIDIYFIKATKISF